MYDIITIGDVTIDLYFRGESLTQKEGRFFLAKGGKYVADNFYESLGGGGANVAVGASHFGLDTAVLAKVGENVFKQIIIQKLIQKNVSSEFLISNRTYMNISAILLSKSGERSIIHYLTPNETLSLGEAMKRNLLQTKMVYMGNLPDISIQERAELLSFFKAKNKTICLNIGVSDCRKPLKETLKLIDQADIFILNTYEFADLVKKRRGVIDFSQDVRSDINYGGEVLVVTDGKNGSYVYYKKDVIHQKPAKPKRIIDTTGAGDAYTSGFLAEYYKSGDVKKAAQTGSNYAALILDKIGAN